MKTSHDSQISVLRPILLFVLFSVFLESDSGFSCLSFSLSSFGSSSFHMILTLDF